MAVGSLQECVWDPKTGQKDANGKLFKFLEKIFVTFKQSLRKTWFLSL